MKRWRLSAAIEGNVICSLDVTRGERGRSRGGAEHHLVSAIEVALFLAGAALLCEGQFLLLFLLLADDEVSVKDAAALDLDGFCGDGAFELAFFIDDDGIGENAGGDFSVNLGGADLERAYKFDVGVLVDDQLASLDGTEDAALGADMGGGGANEVAVDLAEDDGGGAGDLWAGEFAAPGDGDGAVGLKALAEDAVDLDVAEIEVMAALDATAGLGEGADGLRGVAVEAIDVAICLALEEPCEPVEEARGGGHGRRIGALEEVDVLAAFAAKRASGVLGLLLRGAARRAGDGDFSEAFRHQTRRRRRLPGRRSWLLLWLPNDFGLHLRDFVRGHLGLADKSRALFDHQAGGLEVAVQLGVCL